jgi:hypothetical protein
MAGTALLLVQLAKARPQADLDDLISQVFNRSKTEESDNNQQPTEEKNQGQEQGYNPLDCQCVPYYLCQNNTIISDGGGLIDIRLGILDSKQQCLCPSSNIPG